MVAPGFVVLWHNTDPVLVWRETQPGVWVHIYVWSCVWAQRLQHLEVLGMHFGKEEAHME